MLEVIKKYKVFIGFFVLFSIITISLFYTVLKPKKEIDREFYKSYFKSYDFIGHLATAVVGIRDGKQISYEDFCFVKIPFPSIEIQTAISKILQSADNEIKLLNHKLIKLQQQKECYGK